MICTKYYVTCLFSNIHSAGVHFILKSYYNFKIAVCVDQQILYFFYCIHVQIYVTTLTANPLRNKILLITKEQHSY